MLSSEAVQELKTIFLEEFRTALSDVEAENYANLLIAYIKTLMKISKDNI